MYHGAWCSDSTFLACGMVLPHTHNRCLCEAPTAVLCSNAPHRHRWEISRGSSYTFHLLLCSTRRCTSCASLPRATLPSIPPPLHRSSKSIFCILCALNTHTVSVAESQTIEKRAAQCRFQGCGAGQSRARRPRVPPGARTRAGRPAEQPHARRRDAQPRQRRVGRRAALRHPPRRRVSCGARRHL
jgi:hypothetical protein